MLERDRYLLLAVGVWFLACTTGGIAHAAPWTQVALSDSLGSEVDATERETYHLLPDLRGFERARFSSNGSAFRVEYDYRDAAGLHTRVAGVSPQAWEVTRTHVHLVEEYQRRAATPPGPDPADTQFRLALRFASRSRYDVSQSILEDLVTQYPQSPVAPEASATLETIQHSVISRRGLFLPGAIYDRSGRTDLLVFAGYYGIWSGIAIPTALGADSPQAYALGLLTVPAASLLIAHLATKESEIGLGRAQMISLGGHLGTWQGIGWAAVADAGGKVDVATGLLCGLAGIGGATLLTRGYDISEGHGALTNTALLWGGWFGLVAGTVANVQNDGLLKSSLVGSDALVLAAALGARGNTMSRGRVRVISLMGLVGTAFGFGIDLLLGTTESDGITVGIAGAGSVAGLALGVHLTENHDRGKDLSDAEERPQSPRLMLAPDFRAERDATGSLRFVPTLAVRATF